jgi:hypothetical protein
MTETACAGQGAGGFVRDGAHGNGRGEDAHATGTGGHRREVVDFRVLALTRLLDAARRAAAAGEADRERLGQDLHDGVQQRLTALRIRLALATADFEARGDQAASAGLTDFGDEVDRAINELRAFAHGVYPELLTSGGLSGALASAARHTPQPVTVLTRGITRYPSEIETSVYFSAWPRSITPPNTPELCRSPSASGSRPRRCISRSVTPALALSHCTQPPVPG